MKKKRVYRIFELSNIDIGPSKYHSLSKSVDNFLSDNFYKGVSKDNCFHKFPTEKRKILSPKKRPEIIDNEQNNILSSKRKKRHYFTTLMQNKNEFRTLNKTNSKHIINIIDERSEKENNIDKISINSSQDLFQDITKRSKFRMKSPNSNFFRRIKSGMSNRIKTTRLVKPYKNNIIKSFSFINFLPNKINNNKNKKNSIVHSPSSTLIKTKLKNSSFKSNNNNNISDTNSVSIEKEKNNNNINDKIKTLYTLKLFEEKNNSNSTDDDLNMFSNNKIGYSERKHLRQKIKIHNLLSKIYLAKKKDVFKPNLDKIKSNLNFLNKFSRNLFKNNNKSHQKNNLYFFKSPSNINRYEQLIQKYKKKIIPHKNMSYNKQSKNILKNLEQLDNFIKEEKNNMKKVEIKIDINSIKYFSKHFREKKDFDKKIDEQFKKNVMEYQKEIGRFFIYKGNWIYSAHLKMMLNGDKIAQNLVKFENL